MIIANYSDIHIDIDESRQKENYYSKLPLQDIDVLCICGDTAQGMLGLEWCVKLLEVFPNLEIVYINGNHEYYLRNIIELEEKQKIFCKSHERLHFLQCNSVSIKNVKFIGATLWTSLKDNNPLVMGEVRRGINDYRYIKVGGGKFLTPQLSTQLHTEHKNYILNELNQSTEKCVVLTHHQPHLLNMRGDILSFAYHTNLLEDIEKCSNKPLYWFSGHTHTSAINSFEEYTPTVFVSNSCGYPSEQNRSGFNKFQRFEI